MTGTRDRRLPDGIDEAGLHHGIGGWWSLVRLALLGGLLAAAMFGLFGSGTPEPVVGRGPHASLVVETPSPLRNGMFFETRISVTASRPVNDAVVAIPAAVWNDITINTMIPAAAEESFERGYYLFRFGPRPAGEMLTVKIDGQVNPSRGADLGGHIEFRDGELVLARAPHLIRVVG